VLSACSTCSVLSACALLPHRQARACATNSTYALLLSMCVCVMQEVASRYEKAIAA
jgi:hypothetical protein